MADDALLTFDQYATNRVTFVWTDDDGNPVDLTGAEAKLQIRRRPGYPVLYEAFDGGDISMDGEADGEVRLVVPKGEFDGAIWTNAQWDVLVTRADEADRIARGRVTLSKGITTPDVGS